MSSLHWGEMDEKTLKMLLVVEPCLRNREEKTAEVCQREVKGKQRPCAEGNETKKSSLSLQKC